MLNRHMHVGSVGLTNEESNHVELSGIGDSTRTQGKSGPDNLHCGDIDGWSDPGEQHVAGNLANDVSDSEGRHSIIQLISKHV